jgi:protein-arginine kinase activator protein McsA
MNCDIDYLQNELSIAVKNQDYEQAAVIRDSINDAKKKILQKNASEANIE